MARYNTAMSVTFNDNDGGVGWSCNPGSASDVARHIRIFGLWRARWIFFKRFWMAMSALERMSGIHKEGGYVPWVLKAEIKE